MDLKAIWVLLRSETPGLAKNFPVNFNWLCAYDAIISMLCIESFSRCNTLTKYNPINPRPFIGRTCPRVCRAPLDDDVTLFQER